MDNSNLEQSSTEQQSSKSSTGTPIVEVPNIDFDDLQLGKVLGQGGYGRVYQGTWKDRKVAVKEIREGDKSFDIEVQQLSRVNNLNIIELYATSANEDCKYIIMEYADGGSLHNFLHSEFKPFYNLYQGLNWAYQCAMGVSYLHNMKPKPILHRDLKPQNLLLTQNYTLLKICDFGIVAEQKSSMTEERGTPKYMAPEVFKGKKYNEKCDVYSWSILLWEIITRKKPYEDIEASFAILNLTLNEGLRPPLTGFNFSMFPELIKTCWDHNPDNRPTMENVVAQFPPWLFNFCWTRTWEFKEHFPTIPCYGYCHFTNLERIRWNPKTIVYLGEGPMFPWELKELEDDDVMGPMRKHKHKKVTLMTFPHPYGSKPCIWLQQHVALEHKNIISISAFKTKVPSAAILDCTDLIPLHLFLHGDVKLEYSRAHAWSWAYQCAEGMKYLHKIKPKPFIRFALNPTNLILTSGARQLKIGNFEIFEWTNLSFQNIAYEAPEVCKGSTANEQSDVYNWAIILWEILTRKKPFDDLEEHELRSQIIDGKRPAIGKGWPKSIKKLMKKCWDKKREERPTMESVANEMERFVEAPLTAIVSANDLQRIYQPKPLEDDGEDFDESLRVKMVLNGIFKHLITKLFGVRQLIMSFSYVDLINQRISHPNIISLHYPKRILKLDCSEDGFLQTLLHSDLKTKYTTAHALSWAQQCAEACAFLLSKSIRMSPITTSDLLLSNKCRTLKILPHTIVEIPEYFQYALHRNVVGIAYMSPEFFRKVINEKVIVYTWAIILWEMLKRQTPHKGLEEEEIKLKTLAGERLPISEDWPESIKVLMAICWDDDPKKRPTMQDVANHMKAIIADFPGAEEPIEFRNEFDMVCYNDD